MARKKTQPVCVICGEPIEAEGTCEACKTLYASLTAGCGEGTDTSEISEEGGKDDGISET